MIVPGEPIHVRPSSYVGDRTATACVSWDILKGKEVGRGDGDLDSSVPFKPEECYNLNQNVGGYDLTFWLKNGPLCAFSGVASLPTGYNLQVYPGWPGNWPPAEDSCIAERLGANVEQPNCHEERVLR